MWSKIPYHWRRKISTWIIRLGDSYRRLSLKFRYLQDDLYEFNRKANPWLHGFSIILSIAVFISLMLPLIVDDTYYSDLIRLVDQILLLGFGSYFYTRLIITPNRLEFLRRRWPEFIVSTLALFFGIDLLSTDGEFLVNILQSIGVSNAYESLLIIIQTYLVFLVAVKIIQTIPRIISESTNPAQLVLMSFLSVIVTGMLLLMLPAATIDNAGLKFIDALFMATSAVCVTGLIVVDTATHLTMFGQGVILVLIQLGGIGVITFATFIAMYLSGAGVSLAERNVLKKVVSGEDVSTISKTIKHVVMLTLSIELIGFIGYFISWTEIIPDAGERFWFSLFHAVSAFCNAGFSVYTNSLADPVNATNLPVNITTMLMIILGGLGFTTLWEMITRMAGKPSRKRYSIHSIIVFRMTALLIVAGAVLVLILEWDGVLASYSFGDKLLLSVFQSVTSRTAGFNTLDTGVLGAGVTLIIIVLMSIGASPSSTAGGLKTTTIYVLFKSVIANVVGSNHIEIAHRTVPNSVVFRALTSVFLATAVLISGLIILTIVEEFSFIDILFEQVSAFMTVGLSRGITAGLSETGKFIIIISMFAGRVGMLTVAVAFARKATVYNYKYPEESVMVA
jgi:potassium uptake TrkH family protein